MKMDHLDEPQMRCRQCGYDLRRLSESRCPECGREFDPNDSATFLCRPVNGLFALGSAIVGVALVAGGFTDEVVPDAPVISSPVFLVASFFSGIAISSITAVHFGNVMFKQWIWVKHRWALIVGVVTASTVALWFAFMIALLFFLAVR